MASFLRRFDLKLVLLGDKKSGKSALLHQFCLDDFRDLPTTFDTAFAAKRLNLSSGRPVALAIWDTAGSPQFQHISRMYIRGADVVLACFDITSRQNWERLKTLVHEARTRQPGARMYIVATKVDLLQPGASYQQQQGEAGEGEGSDTPSLASLSSSLQELRSCSRPASLQQGTGGDQEGECVGEGPGGRGASDSGQAGGSLGSGQSLPSTGHQQEQQRKQQPCPEPPPDGSAAGGRAPAGPAAVVSAGVQQHGSGGGDEWEACTKATSRHQLRFEAPSRSPSSVVQATVRVLRQAVPDDEVELYCSSVGARLFRTSAKTGEGVAEVFQSIAEECCYQPALPAPRTYHPASPTRQRKSWPWRSHQGSPQKKESPSTPATPQRGPASPPARCSVDSGCGAGLESGRQPGITQSREWGGQHLHQGGGAEQRHSQQQQKQLRTLQPASQQQEYVMDELAFEGNGESHAQGPAPGLNYNSKSSCRIT